MRRIADYIEEARQHGARIIEINPSNETLAPDERKIAPTLLIDPPTTSPSMREEIFGPVLPIVSYGTLDEAIAYVNATAAPARPLFFRPGQVEPREGADAGPSPAASPSTIR